MKRELYGIMATASACFIAASISACGGGGSGNSGGSLYTGKTSQATINVQSVKDTLSSVKEVFPTCDATGVAKTVNPNSVLAVIKTAQRLFPPVSAKRSGKSVSLLSTTPPTATTGNCGGTLSYPGYSHSNGTTSITVKWDNYCTIDSITGNRTTVNGTLSAVDAGTPGASGPVTTKLTATVPGLSIIEKNSSGTTIVSNETISLTGFEYVPATGANTANLSGTTTFTSFEIRDGIKNKEYKLENVIISTGKVGTDTRLSVSGRIYRGTSGYSDLTTDVPFRMYSSNNLRAGKISFTGANGHKATLTAVAGTGQKFTVEVDGTPLTGAQLTCNGL